ncbi:MAG: DUF5395 family protein [Bacillota bacterium]
MKADMEVRLIHDGKEWVASSPDGEMKAGGKSLDDLDEELRQVIIKSGRFSPGSAVTVHMKFDFDSIPTWYRQYHPHYFNRTVTLKL